LVISSPQNETMKPNFVEFFYKKTANINAKNLSVSPMLRPIMSETSKTAKIILVLYCGLGCNRKPLFETMFLNS